MSSFLDSVPIPVLFPAVTLLALAAVEAGQWLGKRRAATGAEPDGPLSASVAATLGLLAFVLAFTFSMAASRFDARRQLVVEDANAIGTTYLRAALLPEPLRAQVRHQLREYVDIRVAGATNVEGVPEAKKRTEQLQSELWTAAEKVASQQPTVITGLFVQALNTMIDVHGTRLGAVRNRIPDIIWFFVFVTTAIGMVAIGFHKAVTGSRRRTTAVCLAVAFAGVIMLIADLDRPTEGFLQVSQQSMIDLQQSMQGDSAASPSPAATP